MARLYIGLTVVALLITLSNIILYAKFNEWSYIMLVIFIINMIGINLSGVFFKVLKLRPNISILDNLKSFFQSSRNQAKDQKQIDYEVVIDQKSVDIFIRVVTYILPILLFTGLYLLSTFQTLNIESANSWVSFILGIAAFVMSLIALWQSQNYNKQSESTFNRILDLLTEIREKTVLLKNDQDHLMNSYQLTKPSNGLGIKEDLSDKAQKDNPIQEALKSKD